MEEIENNEDFYSDDTETRKALVSILPKVKGDLNDEETFQFAFGIKINEYKTKAELKKAQNAEKKRIKELNLVLNRILKSDRKILCFDDSVKIMKTEYLAPVQELYDYNGKMILRSPLIEMGYNGAYYYYDVISNEFVTVYYDDKSNILKEIFRKNTENDLLLELERKDKGKRFGFSKVPNIPKGFKYDLDEQEI
ncbi:hypothetical protein ACRZ9O_02470 [Aquirufa sp. HETE-40SA]